MGGVRQPYYLAAGSRSGNSLSNFLYCRGLHQIIRLSFLSCVIIKRKGKAVGSRDTGWLFKRSLCSVCLHSRTFQRQIEIASTQSKWRCCADYQCVSLLCCFAPAVEWVFASNCLVFLVSCKFPNGKKCCSLEWPTKQCHSCPRICSSSVEHDKFGIRCMWEQCCCNKQ